MHIIIIFCAKVIFFRSAVHSHIAGPILESQGMRAIFNKMGKKVLKKGTILENLGKI